MRHISSPLLERQGAKCKVIEEINKYLVAWKSNLSTKTSKSKVDWMLSSSNTEKFKILCIKDTPFVLPPGKLGPNLSWRQPYCSCTSSSRPLVCKKYSNSTLNDKINNNRMNLFGITFKNVENQLDPLRHGRSSLGTNQQIM